MPSKQRLTHMFPHCIILIVSLVLCVCATCSILLSVLSWTNELWGYYFRTGIWSGVVILITGILGIVCNFVRTLPAVKTFLIAAIFGVIVSLALIALSAGGLDVKSGFYSGERDNAFLNNICHGVSLGVGILQLTLCILCDGICIYYLFIDSSQLYKVEDASKHRKKKNNKPTRNPSRASTRSDAPLVGNSKHKLPKDNKKKRKSRSYDEDQDYQVEYRKPTRRLEGQSSSPNRSPCIRPSSFSTFGRSEAGDRASLIVHPGDAASIADTNRSQTPSVITADECHYAQTMLFDPPLPIEEDDELPPYQKVDPYSQVSSSSHVSSTSSSPLRRTNSAPLHSKRRQINERHRGATVRSSIPRGRSQNDSNASDKSFLKDSLQKQSVSDCSPTIRHSQSADLLNSEKQAAMDHGSHCRDFARSSDIIHTDALIVNRRTNSLRGDRTKRLDRRRRALSAEIKVSREHILSHGHGMGPRTSSIDGSNSGLFASNRIIPTKFSLRTPVRQIGMPHVRSAIPVKSVTSLPMFSPPPKPPRTFSSRAKDFTVEYENEPNGQVDEVFTDSVSNSACNTVNTAKVPVDDVKSDVQTSDVSVLNETKDFPANSAMKIDTGPVIKCNIPISSLENKVPQSCEKNVNETSNHKSDSADTTVMELPMSPTVKCPVVNVKNSNESAVIYAKVNKNRNRQEVTATHKSQKETNTIREQENGEKSRVTEQEISFEDKVSVCIKHTGENKENGNVEKIWKSQEKEPEKLSHEIEKHQNLQVRMPPLSPSERILKGKTIVPNTSSPVVSSSQPFVSNVVSGNSQNRVEHNGARPKINVQNNNKGNDSTGPSVPVPKQRRSVQQNMNDNTNNLSKISLKNRYSIPQDKSSKYQTGSLSQPSTPSSKASAAGSTKSQNAGLSNRHSISATNNIPLRSSSGSLMSARSQGVLLLPQSQQNRHLQAERRGNSPPVNQAAVANQNPQNREIDNALFAKIL